MLPLSYNHPIYAVIFWIAFAIWAVPEYVGSFVQRARAGAAVQDRGSNFFLIAMVWVGLALDFSISATLLWAAIPFAREAIFGLGIALVLLGVALRWYAIRVLGRYFTRNVAIAQGQTVVQAGPYRYIRHPSYSGTLLTMLGFGLALGNWLGLLALMVCSLIGYLYRVRIEERALATGLGQPYVEYMRHTRRFIPFVF